MSQKKKLICLLLAVVLLFAFTQIAFAENASEEESTDINVVNYTEIIDVTLDLGKDSTTEYINVAAEYKLLKDANGNLLTYYPDENGVYHMQLPKANSLNFIASSYNEDVKSGKFKKVFNQESYKYEKFAIPGFDVIDNYILFFMQLGAESLDTEFIIQDKDGITVASTDGVKKIQTHNWSELCFYVMTPDKVTIKAVGKVDKEATTETPTEKTSESKPESHTQEIHQEDITEVPTTEGKDADNTKKNIGALFSTNNLVVIIFIVALGIMLIVYLLFSIKNGSIKNKIFKKKENDNE